MCSKGNQSMYWECTEKLKKKGLLTNQEMRRELERHDGCMQLDKKKELILN